jgi:predicted NBD/HSP70 family sugar kinase
VRVRTKATKSDTRDQNLRFVLQRIYAGAPTTRADIARETGLTATTVSDLVAALISDGIVAEVGTAPSTGGKPPVLVDIEADSLSLITVDLSSSTWRGSVRNLRHKVLHTIAITDAGATGSEAVAAVREFIDELVDASPVPPLGVGVGTPGVVTDTGVVVEASNLGWSNVPLAELLGDGRPYSVHVMNDARATALAEFLRGEHRTGNLIVVKIGRGVGSGIVLDRSVYSGESSAAGEIGHIRLIPRDDELVSLEEVASTSAIARSLADGLGVEFTGRPSKFIATHSDTSNPKVQLVAHQLGVDLATILASVVGTLDVHRIVLSGPIDTLGETLLEAIENELQLRLLPALSESITVTYGHIDEKEAVATGVATFVVREELGVA